MIPLIRDRTTAARESALGRPALWLMPLSVAFCFLSQLAGCRREVRLHTYDKAPMAALESLEPIYKVDNNGRVIELTLNDKHLDEAAVAQVGKLLALRSLNLNQSSFPDEALVNLRELGNLRALRLVATPITDKGLAHLKKLGGLRSLWIDGNREVTPSAVAKLKKARHKLQVYQ